MQDIYFEYPIGEPTLPFGQYKTKFQKYSNGLFTNNLGKNFVLKKVI